MVTVSADFNAPQIEKIDASTFAFIKRGKKESPEEKAIRKLAGGEAIRMPCRWNHPPPNQQCGGTILAHAAARRNGYDFKVKTTCRDQYFYVYRKTIDEI